MYRVEIRAEGTESFSTLELCGSIPLGIVALRRASRAVREWTTRGYTLAEAENRTRIIGPDGREYNGKTREKPLALRSPLCILRTCTKRLATQGRWLWDILRLSHKGKTTKEFQMRICSR